MSGFFHWSFFRLLPQLPLRKCPSSLHLSLSPAPPCIPGRLSTLAMSYRPNQQGGRRFGGRGGGGRRGGGERGGGGRGRGGRGGGEQRWWDPVWRAERLRQNAAEMEVMNENEWWEKLEQMKRGGEQEVVIKRRFRREDQEILDDMAYQLGLYL